MKHLNVFFLVICKFIVSRSLNKVWSSYIKIFINVEGVILSVYTAAVFALSMVVINVIQSHSLHPC